jgi:tyrosyl-tRNA synthetase
MLTHEQVMENAQSYLRQFFKVVDKDKTQVVQQSEWFGKFTLADVINLTGKFTVAQFLQRADFAQRFADKRPIAITEFLYPLLQAYDSVKIKADVEFGGTDQRFNILVGRELQAIEGQTPQQCVLMPILVGTDGVQKMSKSLDNYVGVEEPPDDMYGKLMSIPDSLIIQYFEYLTDVSDDELVKMRMLLFVEGVNPIVYKKQLAWEITRQFHDRKAADAAQAQFERVVQGGDLPDEMPEVTLEFLRGQGVLADGEARVNRLLVATGLVSSNAEAKRMVGQGAVEVVHQSGHTESVSPENPAMPVEPGDVVKVGKRRYVRLI